MSATFSKFGPLNHVFDKLDKPHCAYATFDRLVGRGSGIRRCQDSTPLERVAVHVQFATENRVEKCRVEWGRVNARGGPINVVNEHKLSSSP